MTNYDRLPFAARWRRASSLPLARLVPLLVAALICTLLPERATAPLKHAAAAALAPGQKLAAGGRQWVARRLELWRWQLADAAEQRATAEEFGELRRRNAELETALALALARPSAPHASPGESPPAPTAAAPLVQADLVRARVLGPQARAFLTRLELLDAGSRQGLLPGATVFAGPVAGGGHALLDQGRNAAVNVDDLALAGRSIAGKLVDVGPQTAVVLRLTEPGYRDLVQLARDDGQRLRFGAKGVLEGTGEKLCRISMVEIAEPVSPGDWAISADAGAGSSPAVYGRVTRAERQPGDAHWQIWMTPAIGPELPAEVEILRLRLNGERVAAARRGAAP